MKPKVETYVNHVLVNRVALLEPLQDMLAVSSGGWDLPSEFVRAKVKEILDLVGIDTTSVEGL